MKKIFTLLLLAVTFCAYSQENIYRSPLDIPLVLSANFGELRPNHFHSGIDLKTMSVINKPVYAIADGYVSRINISPGGYGLALYVTHPSTGQTSLYAHLQSLSPEIEKYIRNEQYKAQSYRIDAEVEAGVLLVKKGDFIAFSGNTGSSAGPHVHFEIRDTQSDVALDALMYYKNQIADTTSPLLRGVGVYPLAGVGVVNGGSDPFMENITVMKRGNIPSVSKPIEVWGTVGFGVYATDRMDGTSNIYGVKLVRLYCDDVLIFSSDISTVDFSKTRMINSLTDYNYWMNKRVFYMKSFVESGNKLNIYKTLNETNGYIVVDEERVYNMRYELEDLYGNSTTYKFMVTGKKQSIPRLGPCSQVMTAEENNVYHSDVFAMDIPAGNLYEDICFRLEQNNSSKYLSDRFTVHNRYVPLNDYCPITITLKKDSLSNKSQYGIVRLKGDKIYWIGGKYDKGKITAKIRDLGHEYTVWYDTQAPVITPVQPAKWVGGRAIKVKLSDNMSGVASFKGTVDGQFVLFEHDVKSTTYTYYFDDSRLQKTGKKRQFRFTATDDCGNTADYEYSFVY